MKGKSEFIESLFVSVQINCTIAKLTVWHTCIKLVELSAIGLKLQNLHALRHRPLSYYSRYLKEMDDKECPNEHASVRLTLYDCLILTFHWYISSGNNII